MQAEIEKPRPSVAETANRMICPECGGPVVRKSPRGPRPTFCGKPHQKAFAGRALARGSVILAFAQAWRIDRGTGPIAKASFAEFVSILDTFNEEDRAAGRPRADLYAAKLLDTGYRYMDRKRRK